MGAEGLRALNHNTEMVFMKRISLASILALLALVPSTPVASQAFGNAIAVDGDEVFVGEATYEMRSGVVYVFGRDPSGNWIQTQRIEPSSAEPGDRFGIGLAKYENTLLVSATRADEGAGAVYVYQAQGGTWIESGRLETTDRSPADSLGTGLAMNNDWIMVGTIAQDDRTGAAYAFRREGESWVQHSKIRPADIDEGDTFGSRIALQGNQMLISAPFGSDGEGRVYSFTYREDSDTWEEMGQLQAPALSDQTMFGTDIAIGDGFSLVGAPGAGMGAVFVYGLSGDMWQLASLLYPYESTGGAMEFGGSIALDGNSALIGAFSAVQGQGRVFSYTFNPETFEWNAAAKISSDEDGRAFFGRTVGLGGNIAVGVANGADRGAGAAWVFERVDDDWTSAGRITGDVLGMDAITGDEVSCSTDGEASGFDCESVDLVSFLPVAQMGADRGIVTNDVWGWTDPETGQEIVLVGMSNQTAFVDVTDPGMPTYLGRLPMPESANASTWRDMKVYQNHMFVVSDGAGEHGMQVFDLTRLRGLDGSDPQTFTSDAHYDQIASAHNIVINEETGFAYSVGSSGGGQTCGGGLHMINIQDPVAPVFAGCFQDMSTGRQRTGYSHDAQCVIYHGPDADYQGREICLGSNETALSIADVTDKSNPIAIAMASYPNVGYSHQGWLSEDQSYFFMGDELDESGGNVTNTRTLIWDLADLDDPILAREFMAETKATDHNLYILGNTMYQSNYKSGLRVLDISDPENPQLVGNFDTVPYGGDDASMTGSWSNYPYFKSGVVVVTSSREGLFVVRYRPRTISE
jgi:choice-of-anchor B domain-containing protein|tara:strand:- start:2746 stop:5163 length:2418 start_codon:yes stop_codon:yes gene_type:complete